MRTLLVFVFFSIAAQMLLAQQQLFRKINANLPSPECYRIAQDTDGFIWIATEQGLCRYDGRRTKVYNAKNGLPEKAVYAMKKDKNGQLWLLSKSTRLLKIVNGAIIPTGASDLFSRTSTAHIGYDLFFLENEIVVPGGYGQATIYDRWTKKIKRFASKGVNNSSVLVEDQGNVIPYLIRLPNDKKYPKRWVSFVDRQRPQRSQIIVLPMETAFSSQIISTSHSGHSYFSVSNNLIEIDGYGTPKIHRFPQRILSLCADAGGGFWVGILGHGLYYFRDGNISGLPIHNLNGLSVTNILEDREHHIWCTTLEKGVYMCQQPGMIAFNNFYGLHRRADLLTVADNTVVTSSIYNELIFLEDNYFPKRVELVGSLAEVIRAVRLFGKRWYIGYKEGLSNGQLHDGTIRLTRFGQWKSVCLPSREPLNVLYIAKKDSVIYEVNERQMRPVIRHSNELPLSFLPLNKDVWMVALRENTVIYERKNSVESVRIVPNAPPDIVQLIHTAVSNRIFALTKGSGLFEWKDNRFIDCNKELNIQVDVLNAATEDEQGNLWLATNQGLLFCPFLNNRLGKAKVYNELHGLPSKVCDKIICHNNQLVFSTTEGLVSFPLGYNPESAVKPLMAVNGIYVNGRKTRLHHSVLNYRQQNILVDCSVLSYHQTSGNSLFYTLEHDGIKESGLSSEKLRFQHLRPGTYRLWIYGQNTYGIRSAVPLMIEFELLPPFWLTWWFLLLACCGFIGVIWLLIHWLRRRKMMKMEEENRVKVELAKSQLSALQAQMNPHFLFNSISSIQNYVMSNKREEAYDYLTSFSRLIRRTLNNSRNRFITLEEELETLRLYMNLEQLRYKHSFDFSIQLSRSIDPKEYLIPPSLIQPLLENAIWHGIASVVQERRGEIQLIIEREEELLSITVKDNGRGIQVRDDAHESLAIKIIEEQLRLLEVREEYNWSPKVVLTSGGIDGGTTAQFKIPVIRNE